jgi:serine/threonine protein kinase
MMMSEFELPKQLGRYLLKKLIAKGGMGEVFLAHDPICDRFVALKKIKPEIIKYKNSSLRFIQEAKIAAKLSHPSIVPIFDIIQDDNFLYYTMPYIEGESLRDILAKTIEGIKNQSPLHPIGSSIFSLSQIFLHVCQAIAFCHNQGVLHRDIKPGNIMVGRFGQVLILDWGLAKSMSDTSIEEEFEDPQTEESEDLTKPGKAVGTLSYLAPERALGKMASIQSDIYSLGVVLYQILTLKLPFKRQSLKDFRQTAKFEKLIDPIEMAPYRDIPIQLSLIAKKCLQMDPTQRYKSVEELIEELENYIEGKPDWIFQTHISINNSLDWEFQENVLMNRQLAITRSTYMMEWVALMISKASFSGNLKMVIEIDVEKHCQGVGFLFSIPEKAERTGLEDGFCLWAGTKKNPGFKLFRSNVELLSFPEQGLKIGKNHKIEIEKIDNRVTIYLDGESLFHYIGYIPIVGTHIGLLSKDTDFKIHSWNVYTGSQNAMVNCLSIPDAFLACKEFKKAYIEYQRIAESFKGRQEGREALFRAGITLLEECKLIESKQKKQVLYDLANQEFEKLKNTNGAPLEYLGKSLIYKYLQDFEEETKCLELGIRKFPKNPLLSRIKEEIVFRMHECAKISRTSTYLFTLLAIRHIPFHTMQRESKLLIENIHKNLEFLLFQMPPFIERPHLHLALSLAFWLNKPSMIIELVMKKSSSAQEKSQMISQGLFSLLFLTQFEALKELIDHLEKEETLVDVLPHFLIQVIKRIVYEDFDRLSLIESILLKEPLTEEVLCLLKYFFTFEMGDLTVLQLKKLYECMEQKIVHEKEAQPFDLLKIELLLRLKNFTECKKYFEKYASLLKLPLSPLYTLYGIFSYATGDEKELIEEFKQLFQLPHPPLSALFAHYLSGYISSKTSWYSKSFYFEKVELCRQLELLYAAKGKRSKQTFFKKNLIDLRKASE